MKYIEELQQEINKLYNKGNDLNLLSVISQNQPNEYYLPYTLYFENNGQFLSIVVATDILEMRKFNSVEELVKDMDLYYQSSVFIKKDTLSSNLNKKTPFHKMYFSDCGFNLSQAIWNNDFLIVKAQFKEYYSVFLSDDFEETTPSQFLSYMTNKINEYSEDKINDFERLSILGYEMPQINQIIKSKSIYDIEPLINVSTPEETMLQYNRILKQINPSQYKLFRQCVLTNSDFDFLINKKFSSPQYELITKYLFNNYPYFKEITPDYNLAQIRALFKVARDNPLAIKYARPSFTDDIINLLTNKNFNYFSDLLDENFSDAQIKEYIVGAKLFENDKEAIETLRNYISPKHNKEQIRIIFDLINNNYEPAEIDFITNNNFNAEQMHALMQILEKLNLKQLSWVTPEYTFDEMYEISNKILKGENYKKLLKDYKSLDEIINEKIKKVKNNFKKDTKENNKDR